MNIRLLKKRREPPPHPVWRLVRIVAGVVALLAGLVMLVTPGQGILSILLGLWLLSDDVRLARRAMFRIRIAARRARRKYRLFRERHGHRAKDKKAS